MLLFQGDLETQEFQACGELAGGTWWLISNFTASENVCRNHKGQSILDTAQLVANLVANLVEN